MRKVGSWASPQLLRNPPKPRRSNGTGTLHVQTRSDGRQLWYGRWYAGRRRRNRRIGLKRRRGKSHGLAKIQAEEELRRLMVLDRPLEIGKVPAFAAAVELMLRELEEWGLVLVSVCIGSQRATFFDKKP